MDKIAQLKQLQRDIANALHAQNEADAVAKKADIAYDKAFDKWQDENKALVDAKNAASERKSSAKQQLLALREKAVELLADEMLENLPEGFNQKRSKVVIYDPQGLRQIALQHFTLLLKLDEDEVNKFFKFYAEEQEDGSLILPENIRSVASVEVVYVPKPEISEAKLGKLVFEEEPEEDLREVIVTESVSDEWTAPGNATAILTALPSKEEQASWYNQMPAIEDDSSEGESVPVNQKFSFDAKNSDIDLSFEEDEEYLVPPTEEIFT